ncbi:hypothetical protein CDCA_CDCA09G2680 [Cyanidium caldarium]|uniref:50S ribosomal protein L12, chloroplastic n=1 Tax=Cyanidium caldarium TaxID=2771 RepID=A0AAV9IX36_CYACA|nr:hypothetical protein CDCA_CDCA09G2680 [Cyanidium caldarium]
MSNLAGARNISRSISQLLTRGLHCGDGPRTGALVAPTVSHRLGVDRPTRGKPILSRNFTRPHSRRQRLLLASHAVRPACTAAETTAPPDPKVEQIVSQILSLNLLEAKRLSDALKDRLGIDTSAAAGMGALSPAALAAMQQAVAGAAGAPGVAAGGDAAAKEAAAEKTEFDVKMDSFDAAKKIQVIKEVRAALGLGLKEAKEVVEASPKVIKAGASKEEADALAERLRKAGAQISVA